MIFSAFRGVITMAAAEEMNAAGATGVAPAYYQLLAQWGFALFSVSAIIGSLALAAYGASLLQVGLVPVNSHKSRTASRSYNHSVGCHR